MKVCRLKKPLLIYGLVVPADHWMRVHAERELAVEFDLLVEGRPTGALVATMLKQDLIFSHKQGVQPMKAEQTTTTTTPLVTGDLAKQRAVSRKQKAINIANSAARIMEEQKAKKATAAQAEGETKARVKATKAAVSNGEVVPLKKICADLGMEPRIVRRLLRDAKVDRPDGRWEWPAAEAKAISERITELAKATK